MNRTFALIRPVLVAMAVAGLLGGCKTLDSTLRSAGKLAHVAMSGNARELARIARSPKPARALASEAKALGRAYQRNPLAAVNDLRTVRYQYNQLMSGLMGLAGKEWGGRNTRIPDRRHYVKYTHNYKSRAVVDFDTGRVTVETLETKQSEASLKSAIVTTLLTPDDTRAVDLFSDAEIKLTSKSDPYLYGLILDQNQKPIADPKRAEAFADWLVAHAQQTKSISTDGGQKSVHFVDIAMVSNFEDRQAEKYRPIVQRYAQRFGVSESLVFGVIRAESNFNPFAVSSAPAYGLMQLVPSSGGREGYRHARGRSATPSREFLFNAANNIELGTAYLGLLASQQLKDVYNHTSREYCVIAAYNTGPGNVLKAFSKDRYTALDRINRMQPPKVYDTLVHRLPYAETRRYVQKVVSFRRDYVSL